MNELWQMDGRVRVQGMRCKECEAATKNLRDTKMRRSLFALLFFVLRTPDHSTHTLQYVPMPTQSSSPPPSPTSSSSRQAPSVLFAERLQTFEKLSNDHRTSHKHFRSLFAYTKTLSEMVHALQQLPDKYDLMSERERKRLQKEQSAMMDEIRTMQARLARAEERDARQAEDGEEEDDEDGDDDGDDGVDDSVDDSVDKGSDVVHTQDNTNEEDNVVTEGNVTNESGDDHTAETSVTASSSVTDTSSLPSTTSSRKHRPRTSSSSSTIARNPSVSSSSSSLARARTSVAVPSPSSQPPLRQKQRRQRKPRQQRVRPRIVHKSRTRPAPLPASSASPLSSSHRHRTHVRAKDAVLTLMPPPSHLNPQQRAHRVRLVQQQKRGSPSSHATTTATTQNETSRSSSSSTRSTVPVHIADGIVVKGKSGGGSCHRSTYQAWRKARLRPKQ